VTPRWWLPLCRCPVNRHDVYVATNVDDPWPLLRSSEQVNSDPDLTLLHQRAHGSLEKLVQSARAPEQPL